MKSANESLVNIRQIVFDEDIFFDQEKMIKKLDQLIHAWGRELVQKKYIDEIPDSDDWFKRNILTKFPILMMHGSDF
jgi:hypothetical protein